MSATKSWSCEPYSNITAASHSAHAYGSFEIRGNRNLRRLDSLGAMLHDLAPRADAFEDDESKMGGALADLLRDKIKGTRNYLMTTTSASDWWRWGGSRWWAGRSKVNLTWHHDTIHRGGFDGASVNPWTHRNRGAVQEGRAATYIENRLGGFKTCWGAEILERANKRNNIIRKYAQ